MRTSFFIVLKLNFFLVLLFMLSCESDLQYDLEMDSFKPKLAVNCTFSNDSSWKVYIVKSSAILKDEKWDFVTDAEVTITDANNNVLSLGHNANGQYTLPQNPLIKELYNLKIVIPGFETIEASSTLPGQVQIDSITYKDSIEFDEDKCLSHATISITDDESEINFYQIIAFQKDSNNQNVASLIKSDDIAIENAVNNSVINGTSYHGYLIATDRFFNGKAHSFYFKFSKAFPDRPIYFEVRSLSSGLYKYTLSLSNYIDVVENPFTEPISVYSNIKNGLGIFGGYTSEIWLIQN